MHKQAETQCFKSSQSTLTFTQAALYALNIQQRHKNCEIYAHALME